MNEDEKFNAPQGTDYLWDRSGPADPEVKRLETLLAQYRMTERPLRMPVREPRGLSLRAWRIGFALAGCAVIVLVLFAYRAYNTARGGWQFVAEQGHPDVDGRSVRSGVLHVGQSLETTAGERVRMQVASIGEVEIRDQSQLQLLESRAGRQRLAMKFGTMHARIYAPPAVFVVDTPAARAVDLGCEYTLSIDKSGTGHISVDLGWVQLEYSAHQSLVPSGMVAEIAADGRLTPAYYPDATPEFRAALVRWSLVKELGEADRAQLLDIVLKDARLHDSLTLVNLFRHADSSSERTRIFDRLSQFVPAPKDLNREAVIAGTQGATDPWWPEIYNALHLTPFVKKGTMNLNWYP
jgi:hypothetical protein